MSNAQRPPELTPQTDDATTATSENGTPLGQIDRELVDATNRVGIWTTGGIFLYIVALLQGYPFPAVIDVLRGPVYVGIIAVLAITSLVLLFLGYRFITLRVVRRVRTIYPTLLPTVALGSFILGLLFMAAPGLR